MAHCPTCTCGDSSLKVNPHAPFYSLVILIDRIIWEDATKKRWGNKEAAR